VFLFTDAGGVGLNLQSGSLVVNMDIPWNPAILEQRIGRVHRMGQDRMVRVVNFVSRASIEERILDLLRFKKSLFAGVLDEDGADVVMVGEVGMEKFIQSVEEALAPLTTPDPEQERQERIEAKADEQAAELKERAEGGPPAIAGAGVEAMVDAAAGDGSRVGSEIGSGAVSGNTAGPGNSCTVDAGTRFGTEGAAGNAAESLNTLLLSGAHFLMNLSRAISLPPGSADEAAGTDGSDGDPVQKALRGVVGRDEATGNTYLKIPLPEAETMNRIVSGLGQLLAGLINR
jgi:hypothetical protein